MRRVSTTLAVAALLVAGLAACGSDDNSADVSGSVSVSNAFGERPDVTYKTPYVVDKTEVKVLTEGTGATIENGDAAFVNVYVGNGFTGKEAISTWVDPNPPAPEPTEDATPGADESDKGGKKGKKKDKGAGDTESAADGEDKAPVSNPELIAFKAGESMKALQDAVVGHTVGSRVLVSAVGKDAYGMAGAELNIGNEDTTVFVVDIVSKVRSAVDASGAETPAKLPTVVEADGLVTGLDFSKARKNAGSKLQVKTLVKGDGPAIQDGSRVALRYLGQIWGKKKSFDDNWSAELPTVGQGPLIVGAGSVIEGWEKGLVGVTEGSRVLLVIPSDLAYGKKGKGEDIGPNSDLVFVIDVLGVA